MVAVVRVIGPHKTKEGSDKVARAPAFTVMPDGVSINAGKLTVVNDGLLKFNPLAINTELPVTDVGLSPLTVSPLGTIAAILPKSIVV